MSNVTRLRHALPMSQDINKALAELDGAIAKVVEAAKSAGLPQGIIVSVQYGRAYSQTWIMLGELFLRRVRYSRSICF